MSAHFIPIHKAPGCVVQFIKLAKQKPFPLAKKYGVMYEEEGNIIILVSGILPRIYIILDAKDKVYSSLQLI